MAAATPPVSLDGTRTVPPVIAHTARVRLANRRQSDAIGLDFEGLGFEVSVGFYPDGRPGEVFVHGVKTGSAMDRLLADAAVLISRLLQHGETAAELAGSMGWLGDVAGDKGGPASVIGAVLDLVSGIDAERQVAEAAP